MCIAAALVMLQLGTSPQLPCMMHSSCPSSPYMPSAHPSASVYTHMPSLQQHKMQMSCPWLPHRPSAHPSASMCIAAALAMLQLGTSLQLPCMMHSSCPSSPYMPSAHPSASMCIQSWSSTHNDLSSCLQPSLASSQ